MVEKNPEQERKARLARQLRENLKRRKARTRSLAQARRAPVRGEKAD